MNETECRVLAPFVRLLTRARAVYHLSFRSQFLSRTPQATILLFPARSHPIPPYHLILLLVTRSYLNARHYPPHPVPTVPAFNITISYLTTH